MKHATLLKEMTKRQFNVEDIEDMCNIFYFYVNLKDNLESFLNEKREKGKYRGDCCITLEKIIY